MGYCMIILAQNIDILEINTYQLISLAQQALETLLYVPNERLKPRIIQEILDYYEEKFDSPEHSASMYIVLKEQVPSGFVICQIDPDYRTYSRRATTFGWLLAGDLETCAVLMERCELFAKEHNLRKLRGPINYPKLVGGIGIQTEGFDAPLLNGVNFNHPKSRILEYLNKLGYESESKYSCVHVIDKPWENGDIVGHEYRLGYLTLEELINRKDEIMELATNSFYSILADAPGGSARFDEMMYHYAQVSSEYYQLIIDPRVLTDVPEFIETYNSCDLKNVVTWVHIAFEKDTDKIAGIIMTLPNLYQLWLGEPLTHCNVDTVMIAKQHAGKGVFSSIHNMGKPIVVASGISFVEGTTIWANNDRAIKTIFPHAKPLRTHVVVQKRVK
jgi:hypothetical protein